MNRFEQAKEMYARLGTDAEKALATLKNIPISMHCWQGDDVIGFDNAESLSGGIQTTGNYPGKARDFEELTADMEFAFRFIAGKKRINLHASYAVTDGKAERDRLEPKHFEKWLEFAKKNNVGIDMNPTFFSHPLAENGTLSAADENVRAFWVRHAKAVRKISAYIGERQGSPCLCNVWIPDGMKDVPADRIAPRARLKKSLDEIYAVKYDKKYIVDSVTYWAKNYNVDGFRFDLMGLIDTETMKEVRAALDKIDPSIIILGEGWDMNTTMDKSKMTIQPNAYQVASDGKNNGIAFFNDSIRDGLKGSVFDSADTGFVFDSADTGFVSGKAGQEKLIAHNALGCQYDAEAETTCWNGNAQDHYADAGQVVNYAEIHDNMTLYDKLKASVPTDDEATTVARAKLADSVVYLSEGIPAIQLGQEFLRTKGGNDNSYNAGDEVNAIDWDRTTQYSGSVDYVRGLIKLRNRIAALRQTNYNDINASVTMLKSANGVVAYQAKDSSGTYVVIFNANNDAAAIDGVEAGKYEVLAADGTVYGDDDVKSVTVRKGSAYTAGALSATVLKVASADDVVPVISGVNESTTITVGSKFDPMAGVSATDDIDGDLTDKIKVEGTVDANKVGDYKLVYSVTNSRGKTTTFTRTVHVQKQAVTPAADKNNGNANGKINGKADNTKEDAEKNAAQSPATGSNVAGIALAVMVLAVAAGVLIVLRRKEAGDR